MDFPTPSQPSNVTNICTPDCSRRIASVFRNIVARFFHNLNNILNARDDARTRTGVAEGAHGRRRKRSGAAKDAFAPVLRADGEGCGSVCARCTDRQAAAIPETVEKKLRTDRQAAAIPETVEKKVALFPLTKRKSRLILLVMIINSDCAPPSCLSVRRRAEKREERRETK